MITQLTDIPSGNNTKVSRSIPKSLVLDVTQSYISNQASTSMLTRSMAAKLTATSASECLFANFLSKIEPKKFEKLMIKKFEMSIIGKLTYFLGLQIKQDEKGILIYQQQYTRKLLKKYEISDSSSVKTPMVPPNNLSPDLAGKPVNETSYRGMIRSLMYLTTIRLDIQFFIVLCAEIKDFKDSSFQY
ncbi:uncharacterized mitochondrial protein-like protein [Tanacetum coccineum]